MGTWLGRDEQFAEYSCGQCAHHFAAVLPPLEEKLPTCPLCHGLVCIMWALLPAFWVIQMFGPS
jgi:hypothetical protein